MIWLLENHRYTYPRFITLSPPRLIPPKDIYEYTLLPSPKKDIYEYIHIYISSISTLHSPAQIPTPYHHPCICTTTLYCNFFCICICKSTLVLWHILYLRLYSYVFVRAPLYILWILFDQRIAAKEVQCSTTHGKILNRIDLFTIINHFLSFSTSLTSEVDFLCVICEIFCIVFPFHKIEFVA